MSFLDQILATKQIEIAEAKARTPLSELEQLAAQRNDYRGFKASLSKPGVRVIAEIKRASPSRGDISPDLEPSTVASAYEQGGAAAISVLTEPAFFKGSAADLQQARAAVTLPVLRKEFILEPYQVFETAAMGADAILLIVRILDDQQLHDLHDLARSLGLNVLTEIFDETDATRLAGMNDLLIGINNRDLTHFHTDTARAARIAATLPKDAAVVAASGIMETEDLQRILAQGIRRFLIGEALVRQNDPVTTLREWTTLPVDPLIL
jgi:indole-3-glycerol phosphate synthase